MAEDFFYMATDKARTTEIVKKDNRLIEAKYALSINEQRIIYSIIGKIHADDDDFEDYTIDLAEVADFFGVSKSRSFYYDIQNNAKNLMEKTVDISSGRTRRFCQWLSFLEYNEGEGSMTLRFDKALKPYLLQLKSNFTQYQLAAVANFKNSYSIRFYEFLKMHQYKGNGGQFFVRYSIAELRQLVGIKGHEYTQTRDFRIRVIEPALKEIDLQTDLKIIEVQYLKTGRAISHIKIYAEPKKQRAFAITDDKTQEAKQSSQSDEHEQPTEAKSIPKAVQALMEMGFTFEEGKTLVRIHKTERIMQAIGYTKAMMNERKIQSPPLYLRTVLKNDAGEKWAKEQKAKQERQQTKIAEEQKKAQEENMEAEKSRKERARIHGVFENLSPEEQAQILDETLDELKKANDGNGIIVNNFKKSMRENVAYKNAFAFPVIRSIMERYGLL
jgi:plasmid replication initiation protein